MAERFDKELMAAWRAGYEYVTVLMYPPEVTRPVERGDATFQLPRRIVMPGEHEAMSDYVNSTTVYSLDKITTEQYLRFIRQ